ncbi:hypothetical protein BGZ59_006935 [Podila verticillata]|nr:hypothetical protein BGZ59_006935 [Podila verticillata]KAI9235272.1 MAG: hypothetical protein BYD32DRAFT_421537 [Podila humilis]KFH69802.1 hypothetical protein MVEG_04607 [Podila verticillata NRRL 6337]
MGVSSTVIATQINFDTVFGALLVGASIVLTVHSLSRMIFLKRSGSKYYMFPIINIAQFVNEWAVFLLITAAFGTISHKTALWLNVLNNVAYFITKPTTMYLAYLRCSAVYPAFRKADWLHYFLIGFRAIELFAIIFINIVQNELCDGSVAKGTRCEPLAIAWTFRDAGAPVFRGYYIVCEAIFYYKLFTTLKGMSKGKNIELMQYRRLQTSLFTIDLIFLIFMSIYRIIGIFDTNLATYVYYELFSSTLTIFNLTEFGLNIRMLFNTVTVDSRSNPDSRVRGYAAGPGTALSSRSQTSKLEMGEISPKQKPQPLTNHSSVSLTQHHNDSDDLDISSFMHHDYTPYPVETKLSPVPRPQNLNSEWLHSPVVRTSAEQYGAYTSSPSHQFGSSSGGNEKDPRYGGPQPRQPTSNNYNDSFPTRDLARDSPAIPNRAASRAPRTPRSEC